MKILLISVVFPYPIDDGGRSGTFKMIDYLRNFHEITLICPESHSEKSKDLYDLWPNVKICTSHKPGPETNDFNLRSFVKTLSGRNKKTKEQVFCDRMLLNNTDFVSYYFYDFLDIVQTQISENEFDLIQVEFIEMAPIINYLPKNIKTAFVHHELRYKRMQLEYDTLNIKDNAIDWKINTTKTLEIALINRFDNVIVLTDIDRKILMEDGIDASKLVVSPLPVSLKNHPVNNTFKFKNQLVFLGPEGHYPNLDGVDWFLNNVWDLVLDNNPDLKFKIIGKWTDAIVQYYDRFPRVEFAGFVDDLSAVMEGSIMIVPLRIGSGMRMKILEGASWHVPMVSTTIGAEGLPMEDGENCFIADTPEEFALKINELVINPDLQVQFVDKSNTLFKTGFSIEECGQKRHAFFMGSVPK